MKVIRVLFFVSLAAAVPGAALADEANWSRFRGPNGCGVADVAELPGSLEGEEAVAFRVELPAGKSSPVLWGDQVFVTGFEGDQLHVMALDRTSGERRWQRSTQRRRTTKVDSRNDAASPTSAVGGHGVVSFFPDFGLVFHDHAGEERWTHRLGPFANVYGMGASPILAGDRVLLPCDQNQDSYLLAVSVEDGSELWKVERPEAKSGHCTPVLFTADDGVEELVLPGSFLLDAYDVRDGARRWWVRGLSFEMKSTPVLADGVVYINGYGSPFNQPGRQLKLPSFEEVLKESGGEDQLVQAGEMPEQVANWFEFVDLDTDQSLSEREWEYLRAALSSLNGMLAIRAGGAGDRTESQTLWAWRRAVPQLPSPLLYGGLLYLLADSGGLMLTLDPESGALVERGRVEEAIDAFYASPVAGAGKIVLLSQTGTLVLLPEGGSFDPLSVRDLKETCYATPALAEGRIYVRTEQALWCFGDG